MNHTAQSLVSRTAISPVATGLVGLDGRPLRRARTRDHMTFDQRTVDSTGSFLIGELERLDQTLHQPLYTVTWSRDIDLREDVTIADETSSFTNSSFAATGGVNPNGKAWIGKDSNAIAGLQLDIGKTANPLTLWGMELSWTIPELESAIKLGRPVDQQKYAGMQTKYNMDVDEMVYIGDADLGYTGLFNGTVGTTGNAPTGTWATATADQILADVNALLQAVWAASGYAAMPDTLRLDPLSYGRLVSRKISDQGSISILEFIRQNNMSNDQNGRPLDINSVKWLATAGAGGTRRMVAYTKRPDFVRFPLVPLQRTPLENRSIWQLTTYFGRLGVVEIVYGETMGYYDGL